MAEVGTSVFLDEWTESSMIMGFARACIHMTLSRLSVLVLKFRSRMRLYGKKLSVKIYLICATCVVILSLTLRHWYSLMFKIKGLNRYMGLGLELLECL